MSESTQSEGDSGEYVDHLTEAQYLRSLSRGLRITSHKRDEGVLKVSGRFVENGIAKKMSDYLRSIGGAALTSQHIEIWKTFSVDIVTLDDDVFLVKWYEIIQGNELPISSPADYAHDIPRVWIDPE